MSFKNPHSEYIDKQISHYKTKDKWNTKITQTTHNDFIKDFGSSVFTNFIQSAFTKKYLKNHPCSDCGLPSKERCHGIGEERPVLIRRALEKVYPDITKTVTLKEVLIQFLEEHKTTQFTFKCKECHLKEKSNQ